MKKSTDQQATPQGLEDHRGQIKEGGPDEKENLFLPFSKVNKPSQ